MFWCILLACAGHAHSEPFTIAVPKDVHEDFLKLLGERDPISIDRYDGPGSRRDVVEVLLMHQALSLGGFQGDIKVVSFDGYKRTVQKVQLGHFGAFGPSAWESAMTRQENTLLFTEPLILEGEFEAGLYTSPRNKKALAIKDFSGLYDLSSVSNRNWEKDWTLLESMSLKQIHHTLHWISMAKMVAAQRVDFVLAPFPPREDLIIKVNDIELIPIPGLKVYLSGSRRWIVSAHHSQGQEAYDAIQNGLRQLREKGLVTRAYIESGFFNRLTRDWSRYQRK